MGGKGNYQKKENQINNPISQYQVSCKNNQSHVIFCFDSDDYDKDPEVAQFLQNAKQYCSQHHYDFVWFCKDIERVYPAKQPIAGLLPAKHKQSYVST